MNYRYRIDGEDVIVSAEEHAKILDGIKNKINLIVLRGGKLGINPVFIRKMTETDTLTNEQEEARKKTLQLNAPAYQPPLSEDMGRIKKIHEEFYKRMNWDWDKSSLNKTHIDN